jgi:hypothetical protein
MTHYLTPKQTPGGTAFRAWRVLIKLHVTITSFSDEMESEECEVTMLKVFFFFIFSNFHGIVGAYITHGRKGIKHFN